MKYHKLLRYFLYQKGNMKSIKIEVIISVGLLVFFTRKTVPITC